MTQCLSRGSNCPDFSLQLEADLELPHQLTLLAPSLVLALFPAKIQTLVRRGSPSAVFSELWSSSLRALLDHSPISLHVVRCFTAHPLTFLVQTASLRRSIPFENYETELGYNHHAHQIFDRRFGRPCGQCSCLLAHGMPRSRRSGAHGPHRRLWRDFCARALRLRFFWYGFYSPKPSSLRHHHWIGCALQDARWTCSCGCILHARTLPCANIGQIGHGLHTAMNRGIDFSTSSLTYRHRL